MFLCINETCSFASMKAIYPSMKPPIASVISRADSPGSTGGKELKPPFTHIIISPTAAIYIFKNISSLALSTNEREEEKDIITDLYTKFI